MAQNDYGGLENGILQWLPPNHARMSRDDYKQKEQIGLGMRQARTPQSMKTPPATESNPPLPIEQQSRSRQRAQKRRNQWNCAGGGPGMQAIFLGSNQKSCGTGVFLPRGNGNDSQFSNKPGLSPVLLPSRVVQALKLNVRELGQQIKRQQDLPKYASKKIDEKSEKNNTDDVCLSPDIFLPEEWTY